MQRPRLGQGVRGSRFEGFSDRVLHAANRILQFTHGPIGFSFSFGFLVARRFADGFLDAAHDLLERSSDAIPIHDGVSICESANAAGTDMPIKGGRQVQRFQPRFSARTHS